MSEGKGGDMSTRPRKMVTMIRLARTHVRMMLRSRDEE